MKFDFPIDTIELDFDLEGQSSIQLKINERPVSGNIIPGHLLKRHNIITIDFTKVDPKDTSAFARLKTFKVNDGNFLDKLKTLDYNVNKTKHPDAVSKIQNNLYFGYIGKMDVVIEQNTNLLQRAAWVLANETFENVKWPTRKENFRTKDFPTIHDDYRFMFTGCQPPKMQEVKDIIDNLQLGSLIAPLHKQHSKSRLEDWINQSERVNIRNLGKLDHFTVSNGTTDSLFSFLMRHREIHMPEKMYHYDKQILEDKDCKVIDLQLGNIKHGSVVLLELPSPWYTDEHLGAIIREAKEKECYIAIDLSWLPACMNNIEMDALDVDEIFFSMNKCWPITSLRPALRWSKNRINDSQTFDTEVSIYPKIPINVLYILIDKFSFDYAFNEYIKDHQTICNKFNLTPTSVLWFTTHEDVKHNSKTSEPFFYLDDFVCVVKLLQYKDKFFW